jgi:hypothetical protein
MNNMEFDPTCYPSNTAILDPTFFPVGSAALSPNFNILPFLCQLMQVATNENIDPVLVPPENFDQSHHVNFKGLLGVGDPRWTTGKILSAGFIRFMPRIITQIEVNQAGGTQVIDDYICDSEGNPIRQSLTVPVMTTIGTGGVNVLGYDIPPGLKYEELLKTVTQEEINFWVEEFIKEESEKEADAFIVYLQYNYSTLNGWEYSLHAFKNPPFFYVKLQKRGSNRTIERTVYLKYWDNVQNYVAQQLFLLGFVSSSSVNILSVPTFENDLVARAFSLPIPTYSKIINDIGKSQTTFQMQESAFSSSPTSRLSVFKSLSGFISQPSFDIVTFQSRFLTDPSLASVTLELPETPAL